MRSETGRSTQLGPATRVTIRVQRTPLGPLGGAGAGSP
jgi:hypothetical protein